MANLHRSTERTPTASSRHHKSTVKLLCSHLVPTLHKRCSQPAFPLVHWHLIQIIQRGQASHQALTVGPAGSQSLLSGNRQMVHRQVDHWVTVGQSTAHDSSSVSRCVGSTDTGSHKSACRMHSSACAATELLKEWCGWLSSHSDTACTTATARKQSYQRNTDEH